MKLPRLLVLLFLAFTGTHLHAQIIDGAKWKFTIEQKNETEAILILTADIRETFHIYSQFLNSNDGPIPSSFEFTPNKNFELVGKVEEGAGHEIFDEAFQMKLLTFEKTAVFKQKIKILSKEKFTVEGKLSYMACDNRMCLPPADVPFSFGVNSK